MANVLRHFRILVADEDVELARVLRSALHTMGFEQVQLMRSGQEAFYAIQNEAVDFLITEWNTQHMDGVRLVEQIRKDPSSKRPTLPILMLTGRAEQSDVTAARDAGVNEYVVKPFSPKSIYNRLERLIEKPRPFVLSQDFVGPCRRHVGTPPPVVKDRRKTVVIPKLQPMDITKVLRNNTGTRIWLPDFSLKHKLGVNVSLQSLITPEVLGAAQSAIDAIADESKQWVKEDLNQLKTLMAQLQPGQHKPAEMESIYNLALSINARAGTFGYSRAAEIAYILHLFVRSTKTPLSAEQRMVIVKHVEVLQVILGNDLRGDAGEMGVQIANELRRLAQKSQ
jgi:DNA-binding response OmpR family regulator